MPARDTFQILSRQVCRRDTSSHISDFVPTPARHFCPFSDVEVVTYERGLAAPRTGRNKPPGGQGQFLRLTYYLTEVPSPRWEGVISS